MASAKHLRPAPLVLPLRASLEMAVAVVETTLCVTDANNRLIQGFIGVAHGFRKGTSQIVSKLWISIIGQSVGEPL